jgi:hypothetical protein
VIWAAGRQRTNLVNAAEKQALSRYVAQGGSLFLSGAHIDNLLRPSEKGSDGLSHQVHVAPADEPGSAVRFLSFVPEKGRMFGRRAEGVFGDASDEAYFIDTVCRLAPEGLGAEACLRYPESPGAAAVQYDGSAGGGRVVCFGFPFECVSSKKMRAGLMADALRFLAAGAAR